MPEPAEAPEPSGAPGPSPRDHAEGPELSRRLDDRYATPPPWEIGRPQQAFLALARRGAIGGTVLDVGCGTGEHALMCAGLGLDVTGVDLADRALDAARDKARRRGLTARFVHHDARRLTALGERFDTVLDSGLFHMLAPLDRPAFADDLRAVLRPGGRYFMLGFSDRQPGTPGATVPYRLTRDDLTTTFGGRLRIDSLEPATIEITLNTVGIKGWLLAATKASAPPA
ncbi:class I SAM-dependent methyltransferase [Streptacidiphilus melanogenes]|uniref:class I SAM-dependent methyltransferase n=1 Tax=Streptacidiphilus melanogenes TaxID=411235 RepID=UPI000A00B39A|nr:class I SAM-dependent methyltransferase [Streptacidiphilus melanogenes]